MENLSQIAGSVSPQDMKRFEEFRRVKRMQEAAANVMKVECDLLSAYTEAATIKKVCQDGNRLGLGAVTVLPAYVKQCVNYLGRDPKCSLIAAISYPHGGDVTEIKIKAVKRARRDGVDEVEAYAPVVSVRDGNYAYFKRECQKLKRACKDMAFRLAFCVDTLSEKELLNACRIAADVGVNMIRLNGAASYDIITKVKSAVKDKCQIKVDGVDNMFRFEETTALGAACVSSKNAVELASLISSDI